MCGITGVAGRAGYQVECGRLALMTNKLARRGPDGEGIWISADQSVGFGHRRLSILDLSPCGAQPMTSNSGRYTIAFNGEIYNFRKLRAQLQMTGIVFRGHSDTEVLLAGIEHWGFEQTLKRLAGMFAFALWDAASNTVYLARDRLGIKPLYYGLIDGIFLFASELRPIVSWLGRLPSISPDSLAAYLRLGYVPGPESIFKDIKKLQPGMWLAFQSGEIVTSQPFWSLQQVVEFGAAAPVVDTTAALTGLEEVLSTSIDEHMVADVPLGAFLSGGIDSSTVVALMQSLSSRPINTFSIGFSENDYNEAGHAAAVAKHLRTVHTEFYVTDHDAQRLIPDLPTAYDEPFADVSQIPTMLLSRLTRSSVTVALTGDGGDELFAGYNRYLFVSNFWHRLSLMPLPIRRAMASLLVGIKPSTWDFVFRGFVSQLPLSMRAPLLGQKMHKLAAILDAQTLRDMHWQLVSQWPVPEMAMSSHLRATLRSSLPEIRYEGVKGMDDVLRQMIWDIQTYLVDDILTKVDRASMYYGLEARVPLLDHRVLEYALKLPQVFKIKNSEGKWLLRQLLYRHVPRELVDRPKMGFGVPVDQWLRGSLRGWADSLLSPAALSSHGWLDEATLRQTWQAHLSSSVNRGGPLWTVLMFQAWWESAQEWVN